jgi:hypothetical protein
LVVFTQVVAAVDMVLAVLAELVVAETGLLLLVSRVPMELLILVVVAVVAVLLMRMAVRVAQVL